MATIDDLVRVSGYSRSTVFRYLAGKAVRPAAREAILIASRETGFGGTAKPARTGEALLLRVPAGFEGFRGFADAAEGIMRRAAEEGVPVVFDEAHAESRRIAVVCLGLNAAEEDRVLAENKKFGRPTVFVNRMIDDEDASWASVDFRAAAAEAAERLAACGCKRIAVRADAADHRVDREKLAGALDFGSRSGAAEVIVLSPADGDLETAARKELSGPARADGWLAFSDMDAMRVVNVASELGLRVSEDLSVIGMNDVEGAAYFRPALTSVRVPFRECGIAAVDIALRLLDNPSERSARIILRHRLIERASCGSGRGAQGTSPSTR